MRVVGSRQRAGLFLVRNGSIGIADQRLLRVCYLRLLCEEDLAMTARRLKLQGFKLALCGCLALLLIASACTPPPPPDTREGQWCAPTRTRPALLNTTHNDATNRTTPAPHTPHLSPNPLPGTKEAG